MIVGRFCYYRGTLALIQQDFRIAESSLLNCYRILLAQPDTPKSTDTTSTIIPTIFRTSLNLLITYKKALKLTLKVWRENTLTDSFADFLNTPETTAVQFLVRKTDVTVVCCAVDLDQFTLPLTIKNILPDVLGREVGDAEFFTNLTAQGFIGCLAVVHVGADCRVPLAWLYVLPFRALL